MIEFSFLYGKNYLKRKVILIKKDIKAIIKPLCKERFWVDIYGAYDINPNNLVIWVCVETDEVKSKLSSNVEVINQLRQVLIDREYPVDSRQFIHIGFESQETVDRESDGNWFHHFK